MKLRKRARDIGRRMHDETEVGVGERATAALGAVQLMRVLARTDALHEKTTGRAVLVVQQVDGPRGNAL
jgi:hypothetical protein